MRAFVSDYRFLGPFVFVFVLLVCDARLFYAASIAELKAQAESGNKTAQHQLIEFLTRGDPGTEGYNEALAWLQRFAASSPQGKIVLGYLYSQGHGVARNYAKAAECYEAAAGQGFTVAENNLAYLYQEGLGVKKNLVKAFGLYRVSAKQGNAAAQYNVANLYFRGAGTPRDYFQAAQWFQAAAQQGHPMAQHDLGVLYAEGLGVPRDSLEAVRWIKLAAEQGEAGAETDLGRFYEEGRGVSLDYLQAYAWLSRAVADGDRTAGPLLKELSHLMTPAQIERAEAALRARITPSEKRRAAAAMSRSD